MISDAEALNRSMTTTLSYRVLFGELLELFTICTLNSLVHPVSNSLEMKQPMLYRERLVTIRFYLAAQVEHSLIPEVIAHIGIKCQALTQWLR